jgi:hypothetical protein
MRTQNVSLALRAHLSTFKSAILLICGSDLTKIWPKKRSIDGYGEPHVVNALTEVRAVVIEHCGFRQDGELLKEAKVGVPIYKVN